MHRHFPTPLMPPPAAATARPAPTPRPVGTSSPRAFASCGLCVQCSHAATCTYPHTAGVVIRHCDEFDAPSRPAMWGPSHQAIEPEPSDVECAGLCRNCALAAGCTYPKPVAGVWRCEEYC